LDLDQRLEAPSVIEFEGVHNFRDFGGHAVPGGGAIRRGLLYRSGDHSLATNADLARISELHLAGIVDLRGRSERVKAPCRRAEGFSAPVHFFDGETATMAPHVEAVAKSRTPEQIREEMVSRYFTLPFRPGLVDVYRQYIKMIAHTDGPTLVYCSAGKDRTGVLAGVVQSLLGMHYDDILADYMLTNSVRGQERRVAALRADLEGRFGPLTDEAIRVVVGVDPSFLEAAFQGIKERYPDMRDYAEDVLGCDVKQLSALKKRFLV